MATWRWALMGFLLGLGISAKVLVAPSWWAGSSGKWPALPLPAREASLGYHAWPDAGEGRVYAVLSRILPNGTVLKGRARDAAVELSRISGAEIDVVPPLGSRDVRLDVSGLDVGDAVLRLRDACDPSSLIDTGVIFVRRAESERKADSKPVVDKPRLRLEVAPREMSVNRSRTIVYDVSDLVGVGPTASEKGAELEREFRKLIPIDRTGAGEIKLRPFQSAGMTSEILTARRSAHQSVGLFLDERRAEVHRLSIMAALHRRNVLAGMRIGISGVAGGLAFAGFEVARRRFRRRGGRGTTHCAVCGYDLRESPDGCPECGAGRIGVGVVAV